MEVGEFTGLCPGLALKIEHEAIFLLGSSDEENLLSFVVNSLRRNTWSRHFFWWLWKQLEYGILTLDDSHLEASLHDHGVFKWEYEELIL